MNCRLLVTITNNVNNIYRDQKIKEIQGGIVISNLHQHLRSREMYTLHRWLHGSGCAWNKKHKESFTRTVLVVSFLNFTYSDVPLSEALNWDWGMTSPTYKYQNIYGKSIYSYIAPTICTFLALAMPYLYNTFYHCIILIFVGTILMWQYETSWA